MKTTLLILATAGLLAASDVDPKMATVRKAQIVAIDELGEDVGVANCLKDLLPKLTPIVVVEKDEADVVFRVKAHLPSTTTKMLVGIMGGSPSAHVYAELPDGTKLWDDGAKNRSSMMKQGQFGSSSANVGQSVECGLAAGIAEKIRNAMREARGR